MPEADERQCLLSEQGAQPRSALNAFRFPANNVSFCVAVGIIYWLMTWTFANLRVDAWLDIPPKARRSRAASRRSPLQLRECLQQERAGRTEAPAKPGPRQGCEVLHPRLEEKTFTGTGTVEEWTLQAMEFYF